MLVHSCLLTLWLELADCNCSHIGHKIRRHEGAFQGTGKPRPIFHLHLCFRVCMVLGTTRMVGSQWNFSHGNSLRRASNCCVHESCDDICYCTSLSQHLMPFPVWFVPIFRRLGVNHDLFHLPPPSRDEECAYWGGWLHLAQALVLETHGSQGRPNWCCSLEFLLTSIVMVKSSLVSKSLILNCTNHFVVDLCCMIAIAWGYAIFNLNKDENFSLVQLVHAHSTYLH